MPTIFIGPPGIGKTTFTESQGESIVEIESTLDWKKINDKYAIYPQEYAGQSIGGSVVAFEHNIHWPALWVDEIIPRFLKAYKEGKNIMLSMITPTCIELASKFLEQFAHETYLILPPEHAHYEFFLKDSSRPKTWTNHLLTWNHTLSSKFLLQGLAAKLGIKILNNFPEMPINTSRPPATQTTKQGKQAVIFFTGTLGPFHRGHLELLIEAKKHLESLGWEVIKASVSPIIKSTEQRFGELGDIFLPAQNREIMIDLGILAHSWVERGNSVTNILNADQFELGEHPVQLAKTGTHAGAEVTTFWVNGTDALLDIKLFKAFQRAAKKDPQNKLRLLIIENRNSANYWTEENIKAQIPELEGVIDRLTVTDQQATSATKIREAMIAGDRISLAKHVGIAAVEAYLVGQMYKLQNKANGW